jgi:hypothetical protein
MIARRAMTYPLNRLNTRRAAKVCERFLVSRYVIEYTIMKSPCHLSEKVLVHARDGFLVQDFGQTSIIVNVSTGLFEKQFCTFFRFFPALIQRFL